MASNKSKRKYTDDRRSITERNRASRANRRTVRESKLHQRTLDLVGQTVSFRSAETIRPRIGTVMEVLTKNESADYPVEAKRHSGSYLIIEDSAGSLHTKSRHRVKPVKDNNAV